MTSNGWRYVYRTGIIELTTYLYPAVQLSSPKLYPAVHQMWRNGSMSRSEFYRLVSGAIKRVVDRTEEGPSRTAIVQVARELEHTFAAHNNKFDSERFRRDAGVE